MSDSYVYFALTGVDFDPSVATDALGIIPTKVHRKGDRIGNTTNTAVFSGWYMYSEKRDNVFVNQLVDEVVTKLFDKITIINDLKEKYHLESILEIVLYVDCNSAISTPSIGHDLKTIRFLYETTSKTDVDIYRHNSSDTNKDS